MSSHGTITNDNHAALWHGRFTEGPDAAAVEFETSINDDMRMAIVDIEGSIAHAKMLAKQKLISKTEEKQIVAGLNSIKEDLQRGKDSKGKEEYRGMEEDSSPRPGRGRYFSSERNGRSAAGRYIADICPGRQPEQRQDHIV